MVASSATSDVAHDGAGSAGIRHGLVGFSFVKILAPAYFARRGHEDTGAYGVDCAGRQFRSQCLLAWYLTIRGYAGNHAGLALAISIAALLNAGFALPGPEQGRRAAPSAGWGTIVLRTGARHNG